MKSDKNIFAAKKHDRPPTSLNVSRLSEIPHQEQSNFGAEGFGDGQSLFGQRPSDNVFPQQSKMQNFDDEFANEPSLLEELDIDLQSVKSKLLSTLMFYKPDASFASDPDLTGPLILATVLGFVLTLVS